jgi:hypothetical protein
MTPPDSASQTCHRCRRVIDEKNLRPVPLAFRILAGLALGAVHAGMWLWEDLGRAYCPRCRKWLSFLAVVLAILMLGVAAYGVWWAMKSGLFKIWEMRKA